LIEGVVDNRIVMKSIGFEPTSESGVLVRMSLKGLLKGIPAGIDDDRLLLGKVNCKTQNARLMILDLKEVKAPVCLTAADIARIQVKLDLIMGFAKLHGGTIVALVHILEDVLDSFDRSNGLHIDVTPVLPDEVLAVTDDPSVVDPMCALLKGVASVTTSCPGIGVLCDGGALTEGLGKTFGTGAILHAGRPPIFITTGAMNHELLDKLKQLRMILRKLRGHETVDLLWSMQLGMRLEEDNDVSVRKAPLLELDRIKEARNVTKHPILDVFDEGVKLGMEDTRDQVGTLSSCLTIEQLILDFRPGRIGSHGDEKVSSSKMPVDGQGVLTELLHEACATRERRRKNGSLAQLIHVGVPVCNGIS
jgi:hypothetical protein